MNTKPKVFSSWCEKRMICKQIAYNCGVPSLKKDFSYVDKMMHLSPEKYIFKTYAQDAAFFVAYVGRKHLRIFALAVRQERQRRGIGKIILREAFAYAHSKGIKRVTLRANIAERADVYYAEKFGFVRDKIKDGDWEMHKDI